MKASQTTVLSRNPFAEENLILKTRRRKLKIKQTQAKMFFVLLATLTLILAGVAVMLSRSQKELAKQLEVSPSADTIILNAQIEASSVKENANSLANSIILNAKSKAKAKAEAKAEAAAKAEAKAKKLSSSKRGSVELSFPIRLSSAELDLLYRLVYAEAGNQSATGQQAVCWTILNRLADPRFPATITGIINAPGQFDPVRNGSIDNNSSQKTKDAVDAVLAGKTEDMTDGAQYFCDPSISSKKAMKWFNTLECTTTIGCHSFYKD